jgi:hypothetical protein
MTSHTSQSTTTVYIPTSKTHAGIVIGPKGSNIKKINDTYSVFAKINRPEPEHNRPLSFFSVTGLPYNTHLATIHIYELVFTSMNKKEKELQSTMFYDRSILQTETIRIAELQQKIDTLTAENSLLKSKIE